MKRITSGIDTYYGRRVVQDTKSKLIKLEGDVKFHLSDQCVLKSDLVLLNHSETQNDLVLNFGRIMNNQITDTVLVTSNKKNFGITDPEFGSKFDPYDVFNPETPAPPAAHSSGPTS